MDLAKNRFFNIDKRHFIASFGNLSSCEQAGKTKLF